MRKKSRIIILFALTLLLLTPSITAGAKAKPELATKKKTMTSGQTYRLKLNGVPGKAKVKWKTSNKSVVSIAKRKGNTVTFKSKKKGTATVTAVYKQKKYRCRVTVRAGKKKKPAADHPVLNSRDVTLYHLSESYKDYIEYDSSHLREYRFRVSGTKKEVRDWEISGEDVGYFKITDYGLLQMEWGPAYVCPCVTAMVTAILEDGRKLTATVRAYSEMNIYIDRLFTEFEKKYITPSMTTKEKAEKAAWYISATSDYEFYNDNWYDIFLKGKGDCMASRYALQYLCNHMGIKAAACRNLDEHGKTLVYADGRFYVIVTGFNEPKPRPYGIYEINGSALEELAEKNNFDLDFFVSKGVGTVEFITDEFVAARTGEPLEARLKNSGSFQRQMKSLHKASKAFTRDSVKSDECWKAFDKLEDEWSKYNIRYGEESYRQGFEDGVQMASEKEIRSKCSVLDIKEMTHLVYVYDAIKKLNKLLLGEWEIHGRDGGVLEELDRVCDVIEGSICAEIRLRGEDEMYECLADILDDAKKAPEERAKLLTGQDKPETHNPNKQK